MTKDYDKLFPMPPVFPPKGHPRVYFTKADIPRILENMKKPQNAAAKRVHENNTAYDGGVKFGDAYQGTNFDSEMMAIIESLALAYALGGGEQYGQRAAELMRACVNGIYFSVDGYSYNTIGQTVFTIAEVYDWCYDLLSAVDREAFYNKTIELAAMLEVGWPPVKQRAVVGHGPEGQVLRDLMCAGIAMYDEYPDIYTLVAGRFFSEFIEPRKLMYRAHHFSQGSHYTHYRVQWEALSTWIMDKVGVPNVYGDDQQFAMYWGLYARRPDGAILRDGDDNNDRNMVKGQFYTEYVRPMLHIANYYHDPYLKWEAMRQLPGMEPHTPKANQTISSAEILLLNDPDFVGKSVAELPLTKYFPSPKGAVIARTGWEEGIDASTVVAEMKVNEWWFTNHQHLDAGAFQIYYKGLLASDAGYYQACVDKIFSDGNNGSTGYGSQHDINYNKRTIAHNCMLVFDPEEQFYYSTKRADNDGGQKLIGDAEEPNLLEDLLGNPSLKICDILGHEFGPDEKTPDYTYLSGDLTRAYSDKVTSYTRSFLFWNLKDQTHPAALIVFDRIASADKNFKKTWLLHGLYEPELSENRIVYKNTAHGANGKLTADVLLPHKGDTVLSKVEGAVVNGTDYYAAITPGRFNEGGGWRAELSPKTARKEDLFLNVLQVGDAVPDTPPLPVELIETDTAAGAVIADRAAIFAKHRAGFGEWIQFELKKEASYKIAIAGVKPGSWEIVCGSKTQKAAAVADGGLLFFTGGSGMYEIRYIGE